MAFTRGQSFFSVKSYLEYERVAPERHEFLDGNVYAMPGENARHSTICFNLYAIAGNALRGKSCRGFSPTMKVATENQGLYSYPDLAIVCGAPEFYDENEDVLLNPTVIFEVLSPATECFDRVEKFLHYTNYIESLRDYVLISQDQPMIEHYAKQSNKVWHKAETEGFDAVFFLPTTQFKISLAELYDLVEFF
jgi:Uma2 family endonuclease